MRVCKNKTNKKKPKILDCLSEYLLLTVLHAETTACRCRILYCLKWSQHVVLWGKITTFVPDNIFSNPPNPPVCPALHAADLSGSEGYIKSSEIQNVKTVDSELRNANGSTGAGFKVHVCWYSKGVRSVYSVWKQIQSGGITLRDHTGFKKKKIKETGSEISSIFQMQTSLSRTPSHSAPAVCNGCASGKVIFSGWAHLLQCFENKYKNALFIFFPSHPTGAAEQKELEEPAACLRTLQQSGSSLTRDLERACFG